VLKFFFNGQDTKSINLQSPEFYCDVYNSLLLDPVPGQINAVHIQFNIVLQTMFQSPIWSYTFRIWTKILYACQLPPCILRTCHHTRHPKMWNTIQIILMLLIIQFSPISVASYFLHPYIIPQIMVSNILQFCAFLYIRDQSFIIPTSLTILFLPAIIRKGNIF